MEWSRRVPNSTRVVAAGIAHDGGVVADHSDEGVHAGRGEFIRRVGFAEEDGSPGGRSKTDEAVARGESALDGVVLGAVGLGGSGGGGDVDLGFELIDEVQVLDTGGLEAANTDVGEVRGDVGHPTHVADGACAVTIEEIADAFAEDVEGEIEIAVGRDFAVAGVEGEIAAGLALEELVLMHLGGGRLVLAEGLEGDGFGKDS